MFFSRADLRLYDFESKIEKGGSLRYKISFNEKVIYTSEPFTDRINSSLRKTVSFALDEADITEDHCILILFYGTLSKKAGESKEEGPSPVKEEQEYPEEERLVGKLSMPVSQLIRRSILSQEFRGALKIMKIEENALDMTTRVNDNNVIDAENQFIYNEYSGTTNNITEFFNQEMHGNLLGFVIVSVMIRLKKNLSVIINLFRGASPEGFQ